VQDPGALGQGARDLDRIANHLRCRGGAARNTGGSIGVSLVASVFTYRQQFHQNRLIEQMIPSSTQYQDTLQQITNFFTDHGSSLSQAHDQAIQWIGQQVQPLASFPLYRCVLGAHADFACGGAARADAAQGQARWRRPDRPLNTTPTETWTHRASRPCLVDQIGHFAQAFDK
jgi:hypothetical protein